jgi:hypothetical protein
LGVAFCWDADHSCAHRLSTIVFYFFLSQSRGTGAPIFPARLAGSVGTKAHRDVALLALNNESEASSCGNVAFFFFSAEDLSFSAAPAAQIGGLWNAQSQPSFKWRLI